MNKPIYYAADWIKKLETKYHWELYWHQVKLIEKELFGVPNPIQILELGIGSGFLKNYLQAKGHSVLSIDIDPDKKPDIIHDIRYYHIKESFDIVLAYEIFEHFPFEDLPRVLKNLHTICKQCMCVGLPEYRSPVFEFFFRLCKFSTNHRIMTPTLFGKKELIKAHHWEVNQPGFSLAKIENSFAEEGFKLDRHIFFERHHFFKFSIY